jgi:hypothetical protein
MKKAKKYVYPLLYSVGFLIFWVMLVFIINSTSSGTGYGGLVLGMLILFSWLILGLPICCIRYCKIIADEKSKFGFCIYNYLMIIIFHLLPFNLRGQLEIIAFFVIWVLFWNIVPMNFRSEPIKKEEKDTENENQN